MKVLLVVFWEKISFDLFKSFFNGFDRVWSKLSQAIVTIGSLKGQKMINTLKQSCHDFPGKCLCGGYCT